MFSVCALFYGDHADLAARLLASLADADEAVVAEYRFGLNAVCEKTLELVNDFAHGTKRPAMICMPREGKNVGKYPLMRKMFHDPARPLRGDRVMWFDDDSYVTGGPEWWGRVHHDSDTSHLVGAVYSIRSRGEQYANVPKQPWYGDLALKPGHVFRFCTGGWWICRTDVLRKWDYPWPVLHHNGGDSLLGELVRQQKLVLLDRREGVRINADWNGVESKSPRRGIQSKWPWQDGDTVPAPPFDAVAFLNEASLK